MTHPWILSRDSGAATIVATLNTHGVAIIRNALTEAEHAALYADLAPHFVATEYSKGLFYGTRTKRFGRVVARSSAAQSLALNPLVIGTAETILKPHCQDIQLNLTQAIEIWPGSFAQVPHRDQDIWLGAETGKELMINAMWALDDFTAENGATLIWPGSHRSNEPFPTVPGVAAEMPAGSLCLFLGSTLHAGGPNWSGGPRRGLILSYCQGWLKPCENPWLSYPPEVARRFPTELARLVGYRQDAPSLNNVEGRCPSELLRLDPSSRPFTDQLTDEQNALIEQYNQQQLNAQKAA